MATTETAWGNFISRLCTYFERKLPAPATIEVWYQACKYIPLEALLWIESQLQDIDTWPKNFPGTVKKLWFAYREAHPEKATKEELGCDRCHQGFLTLARVEKEGLPVNYLVRCTCNGGRYHRLNLIELGYGQPVGSALHPYHSPFPVLTWEQPEPKSGSIQQEDIEKAIPF